MKIALIGYGKMGKEIEKIALERGHEVVAKFSSIAPIQVETLADADVAIDFTRPEMAVENIAACFAADMPIVVGTTGWYGRFGYVKNLLERQNQALFYATNFSVGVNIMFAMNKKLAKIMNGFEEYEPHIHEVHHTEKRDAPSGTAISLAEQILDESDSKKEWKLEQRGQKDVLSVSAERLPEVPGTHVVSYENDIDKIELTHTAKSRAGFALGAILAAEFLKNKKGLFTMKDLLSF